MTATGNEPVKLSQLKSVVPGISLRKFDFKITTVSDDPVQLPFAPEWGITVFNAKGDSDGNCTACFMDYGKTVQLLSLRSLTQIKVEIWLYYAGTAKAMSEKLANVSTSSAYTVTKCNTNDNVFSSTRNSIEDYEGAEGYSSRLNLESPNTIFANWPFLFINLFFEK